MKNFVLDNPDKFKRVADLIEKLLIDFDEYGGPRSAGYEDITVRMTNVETKRGWYANVEVTVGLETWKATRKSAKKAANAIIAKMVGDVK